jgi:hypothetical protein
MEETEKKQNLASKLITGLRKKLHKKSNNEQENIATKNQFPTPKDVAAIFNNLQDKWENEEAEKSVLYRFIDEWVISHNKKS